MKVPRGALCFSPLFLPFLGTKLISFCKEELQVFILMDFQCHLEFDPQIPLPLFDFMKMETLVKVLHLPLKALVFETNISHERPHLY